MTRLRDDAGLVHAHYPYLMSDRLTRCQDPRLNMRPAPLKILPGDTPLTCLMCLGTEPSWRT